MSYLSFQPLFAISDEVLMQPVFIVFAFLTITAVVSSLASAWRKVKEAELMAQLKSDMVQRGMSAEEIRMVIEARPSTKSCKDEAGKRGTDVHFH